jgi:hypothetical protein
MKTTMVKTNIGKFAKAKLQFASNLDGLSNGITKLTAMDGGVTPEQVSEVLSSEVLPAIEGVKNVIAQIDEALPTAEGEGEMGGLGEPAGEPAGLGGEEDETGVLSAMDDGEDDDEIHTASDAEDAALQKRLQHMEAKMASLLRENIGMKKASLSKKYAAQFPIHMRSAMEEKFMEENEDEELDAMEAKLATASSVLDAYKTAGLIKKSNIPVGSGTYHTAKNDKTKGGQGKAIPWYMR